MKEITIRFIMPDDMPVEAIPFMMNYIKYQLPSGEHIGSGHVGTVKSDEGTLILVGEIPIVENKDE